MKAILESRANDRLQCELRNIDRVVSQGEDVMRLLHDDGWLEWRWYGWRMRILMVHVAFPISSVLCTFAACCIAFGHQPMPSLLLAYHYMADQWPNWYCKLYVVSIDWLISCHALLLLMLLSTTPIDYFIHECDVTGQHALSIKSVAADLDLWSLTTHYQHKAINTTGIPWHL